MWALAVRYRIDNNLWELFEEGSAIASDYLPLAKLIAEQRRRRSLSLSEVAQRMRKAARVESQHCGADRKAIHDYEQGRIPHPDGLRWLAMALDLPIEQVVAATFQQRTNRQEQLRSTPESAYRS